MIRIKEIWKQYKKDPGRVFALIFSNLFTLASSISVGKDMALWLIFPLYVVINVALWVDAWLDYKKFNKK